MFRSSTSSQDNMDGRSLNDIDKDYGSQVIARQLNIRVWSFISVTFVVKVPPLRTPISRSLRTTKMINISWMNAVISVYPVHLVCSWVSRGGRKKISTKWVEDQGCRCYQTRTCHAGWSNWSQEWDTSSWQTSQPGAWCAADTCEEEHSKQQRLH